MPSVVSITISERLEDLERELPHEHYSFLPGEHHGRRSRPKKPEIPQELVDEHGMVAVGGGSGFAVAPDLVLTNKHVLSDPKAEYTVITADGRKFKGDVLSRDPVNDIAILKIEGANLAPLELGDATKLELGQSVITIGNALGLFKNTVSLGIVSGLSRAISAKADPTARPQELRGLIQTDAAVNVGNSGGPLVDLSGKVVGVNAAIVSGAQSIGFAIPVNAAHRDLDDIRKHGRIRRPLLGVRYIMIDAALKEKMKLSIDHGALVVGEGPHGDAVVPESPAAEAGVREHDIILAFNDIPVGTDERIIQDFLEEMDVGDEVHLDILRDGKEVTVSMRLAERL
jgi:S1-C subfamily serine protease